LTEKHYDVVVLGRSLGALVSAAQYFHRFWSQLDDRIKQRRKLSMLESQKKQQDAVPL